MGQRHFFHVGAQPFQHPQGFLNAGLYFLIDAFPEILFRHADAQSLNIAGQGRHIIGNVHVGRRGIHRVMAGNGLQHVSRIFHGSRQWPNLIQGRRIRHQSKPGDETVGRF